MSLEKVTEKYFISLIDGIGVYCIGSTMGLASQQRCIGDCLSKGICDAP